MLDVTRNTTSRFTFDASQDNSHPVWSPEGSRIAFASRRDGRWGIYVKAANGAGPETRLLESQDPVAPKSWSPDGESIVYVTTNGMTNNDLSVLSLATGQKPISFLQTPFSESQAQISPNGRWLSFGSNESGESNFVYVKPFPSGAGQWQVSTPGGLSNRWRTDGKELFFVNRPIDPSLMAVEIDGSGAVPKAGTPHRLFDVSYAGGRQFFDGYVFNFDVSGDGQRFLVTATQRLSATDGVTNPIAVVLNWSASVRK
jgi:serine/threonine-protein kinase